MLAFFKPALWQFPAKSLCVGGSLLAVSVLIALQRSASICILHQFNNDLKNWEAEREKCSAAGKHKSRQNDLNCLLIAKYRFSVGPIQQSPLYHTMYGLVYSSQKIVFALKGGNVLYLLHLMLCHHIDSVSRNSSPLVPELTNPTQ